MPGLTRHPPSSFAAARTGRPRLKAGVTGVPLTRQAYSHRLAFPAVLVGSCALAFGPWLVRLSGVGAVAAGFLRLALALPFLFVIAALTRPPIHWPVLKL